jgi:hypothetical protein
VELADLLGRGQEFGAGGFQVPEDRCRVLQKLVSLNRETTGLLERAGQLQDAGFAEMAGEDLHADG